MNLPTLPSPPADSPSQSMAGGATEDQERLFTVLPAPSDDATVRRLVEDLLLRPSITGLATVTAVRREEGSVVVEQVLPAGAHTTPVTMFDRLSAIAHTARILATCHDAGICHGAVNAKNLRIYADGTVVLAGAGMGAEPADDVQDVARLAWEWCEPGSMDAQTASVLLRAYDDDPRLRPTMAQVSVALADALRRRATVISPPAVRRTTGLGRHFDELDDVAAEPGQGTRRIDAQLCALRGNRASDATSHGHVAHGRRTSSRRHQRTAVPSPRLPGGSVWVQGITRRGIIRGCVISLCSSLATVIAVSGFLP
jgi:hypothetical protein